MKLYSPKAKKGGDGVVAYIIRLDIMLVRASDIRI
jgi:hypothetical protein